MTHYVQVVVGEVKQVWDTPPAEGVGNNGWRNAVEVRPTITAHRQGYTQHTFNLDADPVQITWGTYDITVEDRKSDMKSNASFEVQQLLQVGVDELDTDAIDAARADMLAQQEAIDACTTHDELDALL